MVDFITIISGVPRSGTSMLMQMLVSGGMKALSGHERQADESNPRGYFEYAPVKNLRNDKSWVKMPVLLLQGSHVKWDQTDLLPSLFLHI